MKVQIKFTVDIDAEAWMRDYGVTRQEVRDDVRIYVENGMRDHFREMGQLVEDQER